MIKLLIEEDGSEEVTAIWNMATDAFVSRIAYPEARAALASARRARRVSARALRRAVEALDLRWLELNVLELDAELAHEAGELAETQGLRGYDAVQLASGLALGHVDAFITWDRSLALAARGNGLSTAPV